MKKLTILCAAGLGAATLVSILGYIYLYGIVIALAVLGMAYFTHSDNRKVGDYKPDETSWKGVKIARTVGRREYANINDWDYYIHSQVMQNLKLKNR